LRVVDHRIAAASAGMARQSMSPDAHFRGISRSSLFEIAGSPWMG
jgi:hypothetical protein